jgi:hypothetical protein
VGVEWGGRSLRLGNAAASPPGFPERGGLSSPRIRGGALRSIRGEDFGSLSRGRGDAIERPCADPGKIEIEDALLLDRGRAAEASRRFCWRRSRP